MRGLAIYPKWFWVTLLLFVPAICVLQPKSAQGYAILTALILSMWRSTFLHPLSRNNRPYLRWLKSVPYSFGKLIPHGSVLPGVADLLVFLILCLPVFISDILRPEVYIVFLTAAFFLGYNLVTIVYLFKVGPVWHGYLLIGYTLTVFRLAFVPMLAASNTLMLLFIVVGFGLATLGQWLVLRRYPWPVINLDDDVDRGRLDNAYGHKGLLELGEPYTSLSPRQGFPQVRREHAIGVSLLCGLFMLLYGPFVHRTGHFATAITFIAAIALRHYFYFSNKKPGGFLNPIRFLWQDLKRGRWTRNALLTIVILAAIASAEVYLLRRLSVKWSLLITPIATALTVLAAYIAPPSRRQWDLTGKWQLRTEPIAHFTKTRMETLRLHKSE